MGGPRRPTTGRVSSRTDGRWSRGLWRQPARPRSSSCRRCSSGWPRRRAPCRGPARSASVRACGCSPAAPTWRSATPQVTVVPLLAFGASVAIGSWAASRAAREAADARTIVPRPRPPAPSARFRPGRVDHRVCRVRPAVGARRLPGRSAPRRLDARPPGAGRAAGRCCARARQVGPAAGRSWPVRHCAGRDGSPTRSGGPCAPVSRVPSRLLGLGMILCLVLRRPPLRRASATCRQSSRRGWSVAWSWRWRRSSVLPNLGLWAVSFVVGHRLLRGGGRLRHLDRQPHLAVADGPGLRSPAPAGGLPGLPAAGRAAAGRRRCVRGLAFAARGGPAVDRAHQAAPSWALPSSSPQAAIGLLDVLGGGSLGMARLADIGAPAAR